MNILEKILEEIDKKADYYESDDQGREHIRMVDMVEVEEIIRFHMDDVPKCGECSRRKRYQIGYEDGTDTNTTSNDGWIPVSERMPEEYDSIFAKFKGTDKWSNAMFEKRSDDVNITYEFEDGTRKTATSYTIDGEWKLEHRITKRKVIAWHPLPEPYKGE